MMTREFPAIVFFAAVVAFWFWQQDYRQEQMADCMLDMSMSDCRHAIYHNDEPEYQ